VVTLKEGFSSWNFDIVDGKGTPVWRQSGTDRLPELIRWNGRNDSGRIAEGEYRARFAVTYEKGNRPEVTSVPFILDVSPPEISLSLSPKPFSPDNDGIEDELAIRIGVRDASRVESWNLKIFDPQKSFFTEFAGAGSPAERIIWDGKGRFGSSSTPLRIIPSSSRFRMSSAIRLWQEIRSPWMSLFSAREISLR
jgi:hypothetical protein